MPQTMPRATAAVGTRSWSTRPGPDPVVDVVVPVYNEQRALSGSVRRLRAYLDAHLPWPSMVTIVDNGSTDATPAEAQRLAHELSGVRLVRLEDKGRGRALRVSWGASEAPVVAYMDVDLSTSLEALLPLLAPLVSGHSDIAVGSRLAPGARVVRGTKREVISRGYNLLLHLVLGNEFSDAQCGFKAMRSEAARILLPFVVDNDWFFDTELLVLAEEQGMRVHEVAVDWTDDPDSRVDVRRTARDDLIGVLRLLRRRLRGQVIGQAGGCCPAGTPASALTRFVRVGTCTTAAFLVLFFLLRPVLGGYGADAAALGLCTVANAVAHRHLTVAGRLPTSRLLFGLVVAYATGLAATAGALAALDGLGWHTSLIVTLALLGANATAALVRFVLLRVWISTSAPAPGQLVTRTHPAQDRSRARPSVDATRGLIP